jgi:hypothetical protein
VEEIMEGWGWKDTPNVGWVNCPNFFHCGPSLVSVDFVVVGHRLNIAGWTVGHTQIRSRKSRLVQRDVDWAVAYAKTLGAIPKAWFQGQYIPLFAIDHLRLQDFSRKVK